MDIFPTIHTQRLDLIEIEQSHLNDLFDLFKSEEVTRYYNLHPYRKIEDAQPLIDWFISRFQQGLAIRWGIALKGERNIIGTVGFNNYIKNHRANIGYDLQQKYWNKGYITEALSAIIQFGFKELDINRIEAEVMQGNPGSDKVLEKLGFKKEGLLREWMLWDGIHYDMTMYSLLKKEYIK